MARTHTLAHRAYFLFFFFKASPAPQTRAKKQEAAKKGQAPGGAEAPQAGPKGGPGDEKIIDADFKTK